MTSNRSEAGVARVVPRLDTAVKRKPPKPGGVTVVVFAMILLSAKTAGHCRFPYFRITACTPSPPSPGQTGTECGSTSVSQVGIVSRIYSTISTKSFPKAPAQHKRLCTNSLHRRIFPQTIGRRRPWLGRKCKLFRRFYRRKSDSHPQDLVPQ